MDMVNQIRAKYNTVIENLLKKYSEELFEIATSSTTQDIEIKNTKLYNYR